MSTEWISLDEACARGATAEAVDDALKSGRVGVAGRIATAPAGRLRPMRYITPGHVEDLLAKAVGPLFFKPGNRLQACIMWDDRVLEADTCIFTDVRVYWPELVFELAAVGVTPGTDAAIPAIGDQVRRRQRAAYRPALEAFIDQLPADTALSNDAIAGQFMTHMEEQKTRGEPVPFRLPQRRNIEIQVEKLRPKVIARRGRLSTRGS